MPYIGKSPTGSGVRQRYHFTATGGETSLSGADDNSKTLKFTDGEYVDVYLNGILLVQGTDYGVGTANTISSLAALSANDIVEVVVYDIFNVAKINSEAVRARHYYTATGGETSIGTSQIAGLSFAANAEIDVSLNGISLVAGTEYNTTTANTVGGLSALSAGNVVEIVIYEKFQLADTVSKASGGTFNGPVTFNGDLTVDTSTLKVDSTNNRVGIVNASPSVELDVTGAAKISGDLTVDTDTLYVDSTNNRVGIGTTSPDAQLDIEGASATQHINATSGNANTFYQLAGTTTGSFEVGGGNSVYISANNASGAMYLRTGGTNTRMTIESNGNWKYSGLASGAGTYPLKWNASTGAITFDTSARQVKDNIVDCSYGLSEILQLQPRQYNRNDDGNKLEIGFVADEVTSVMPEFVPQVPESVFTGNADDATLVAGGVNYEKLVAVLTKAIQEQNETIIALEARIAALENVE